MGGAKNKFRQTDNIEGEIKVLMKALADLAPHPNSPHYSGPLFITQDGQFNPPVHGSRLKKAFSSATNNNSKVMRRQFNRMSHIERFKHAFYADLPKRLGIEANIAVYMRKLCSVRKNAVIYPRLQVA